MDPFKRSIVVDEEAVLEGSGTRRVVGFEHRHQQPSTSPGSLGFGFGHRQSGLAGGGQQGQRMMTKYAGVQYEEPVLGEYAVWDRVAGVQG